jgi:phenylacetate-coenzyme A ligase PaaK-like adenylate-forming protein
MTAVTAGGREAGAAVPAAFAAFDGMLESAVEASRWYSQALDASLGPWLSTPEIERRRAERLRHMLDHARTAVPLYRRLHEGLGEVAELARYPLLTKAMLRQHLGESVADPALTAERLHEFIEHGRLGGLLDDRYAVWTSSGSTGPPAIFVHDRAALAIYESLELFRARGLAAPGQWAPRVLAGERYALVAATGGHFAGVATIEYMRARYPWLAGNVRTFSLLQPLPQLVAELNAFAPSLLATYPTAAGLLAEEQVAGRLHLRPDEIWAGGETLSEALRARVQRAFGCRMRQSYGASEFMALAFECERGRLHLNADWAILEPVDAGLQPVAPGTPSTTVLLTNLANRAQPLIRYDLGDSVTMDAAPCACGCSLPSMTVEGRSDDVLELPAAHGGKIRLLPLVLQTVLEDEAQLDDYQLVQTGARRLLLRITVGARQARRARELVLAFIAKQGAGAIELDVVHDKPHASRSGKLRRILREAGPRH